MPHAIPTPDQLDTKTQQMRALTRNIADDWIKSIINKWMMSGESFEGSDWHTCEDPVLEIPEPLRLGTYGWTYIEEQFSQSGWRVKVFTGGHGDGEHKLMIKRM